MIAFDVSLNGKRACVAGVEDFGVFASETAYRSASLTPARLTSRRRGIATIRRRSSERSDGISNVSRTNSRMLRALHSTVAARPFGRSAGLAQGK